jgi:hypothetical protein
MNSKIDRKPGVLRAKNTRRKANVSIAITLSRRRGVISRAMAHLIRLSFRIFLGKLHLDPAERRI